VKSIFTMPAGAPFARILAGGLIAETKGAPERLAEYRIILPTRRACHVLQNAFLNQSDVPLLLPRMHPIGDVDEHEIAIGLMGAADFELPLPSINPIRRRILLARLVRQAGYFANDFGQSVALADALASLMDHVHTEGLNMADMVTLVPDDFAAHWGITIKFLEILSHEWPKILKAEGLLDPAQRRDQLINALARYWLENPPDFPVIAAGSTGSIPATARLLETVAGLPQGAVILPGLDNDIDEDSWAAIADAHPQAGLKRLLDGMGVRRADVQVWPTIKSMDVDNETLKSRRALASEMMRPAETLGGWMEISTDKERQNIIAHGINGLTIAECMNEREEATVIALALRETLETPGHVAALITPDRVLARRVSAVCKKWGIQIDDSAGTPLNQTPVGVFLRLCIDVCVRDFAPHDFLALVKNQYAGFGIARDDLLRQVGALERSTLRGLKPGPGIAGLRKRAVDAENKLPGHELIDRIEGAFAPLLDFKNNAAPFDEILAAHIKAAENAAANFESEGAAILWRGEDGEAAAALLSDLMGQSAAAPPVTLNEYANALQIFMRGVTVRPAYGTHPRLMILGQIEARLIDADLIILGGLSEGTWPGDETPDPWMSRPMRADFGLPPPERATGLSAHDFVQAFCAKNTLITYPRKKDGTPVSTSRWIRRLSAVMDAANIDYNALKDTLFVSWARAMDAPEKMVRTPRPVPAPPVSMRPRRISASRIETWFNDPYQIYARSVLRLQKLDPIEKEPEARDRGNLLHSVLEKFVQQFPVRIPENAAAILREMTEEQIKHSPNDPAIWAFWRPRFDKIFEWVIEQENTRRSNNIRVLAECKGDVTIETNGGPFIISAKADRIELNAGNATIIDYKSGGSFTLKGLKNMTYPQLWVEAMILKEKGFKDIAAQEIVALSYWMLKGGAEAGKSIEVNKDIHEKIEKMKDALRRLIEAFDIDSTPYHCQPGGNALVRFNDFEHLSRIREWGVDAAESAES
jgi:ATP-dependent helicase/nuclease subunit B